MRECASLEQASDPVRIAHAKRIGPVVEHLFLLGLLNMLREELGIPVFVAEEPLLAVVRGAGMVLEDLESYKHILNSDV